MDHKPLNKSQFFSQISQQAGLTKKQVAAVFEVFVNVVRKEIGPDGPGELNVVGLMKIQRIDKPAVPARKGISNFTGKECIFKPKPATSRVKVSPLKPLKLMVSPPTVEP